LGLDEIETKRRRYCFSNESKKIIILELIHERENELRRETDQYQRAIRSGE